MKREKTIWYHHQNPKKWKSEYPECSIWEYLYTNSKSYPSLIAIEFEGHQYTYKSLIENIDKAACALVHAGIKKGDVVSIISPNTPQALFMIYAVNRLGGILNMIHPMSSVKEIKSFVEETESKMIMVLDMIYPKIAKIEWKMENQPLILLSKVSDGLGFPAKQVYNLTNRKKTEINPKHKVLYWQEFIKLGTSVTNLPENVGNGDDVAAILYSGGTSGTPKGVMITNRNMNSLALHTYDIGGIEEVVGKKSLALMPIFHGFGLVICVHAMICLGFHVYLIPKYDFKSCTDLIFKKKINCIYGVPGLFEALIRNPKIDEMDLSFLELLVCGGDKLPIKLQKRVNSRLKKGGANIVLREAYGQTECVAGCSINPKFDTRMGSAGIAYPDVTFKIVDPQTHQELPEGHIGELCVSGPIVMKGYYKNPEETDKVLRIHQDGKVWLHTGDLFYMDKDGYIYFHQRNSRMLVSGGYNIYMTQVENAISTCNAVAECCVVGKKDRILGQRIVSFVVLHHADADKKMVKEKILESCFNSLPQYSIPHEILFCDSLPRTSLGKIDYLSLENEINK